MLSEISETEKDKNYVISLMWNIKKVTNQRKTNSSVPQNGGYQKEGNGETKLDKGLKYMVMEGN